MKKLLLMSALLLASTLMMVGCKKDSAAADSGVITLNVWDIMVTADEERVIKPAVDKWNAMHPNIQVVRDSLKDEPYRTKIATAVAANEQPDLFYGWAGGMVNPFIEAGKVLNLNDYLSKKTLNKALPGVMANVTNEDGIYGLPYAVWTGVLYCNEEMFADAGLELPETYSDLLNCIEVFKSNGIGAIGTASEQWVAMFYHNILALRTAGSAASNAALHGDIPFNAPEFVEAANLLEGLVAKKSFNNGFMGMDYDAVQAMFIAGQIPMFYQGDWVAGDCELPNSDVKGKVRAIHFPYIEGKEEFKHDFLGGAADAFFVSADTKHPKEAVMFLEYLANELSFGGAQEGLNHAAYKHDRKIDQAKLNRVSKQIAELVQESTGFTLAWDTFLPGKHADTHLDAVMEVMAGAIDGEEFSKKMQTINE